jgi:dihydrofolate reductase
MPLVSLVAAVARNHVIGAGNRLPWHLPEDLKRFKRLTMGAPVIMGRKTHESILERLGRPLPGRRHIVVTRQPDAGWPGCEVAHSLDDAIALALDAPEVFVIGGAELYRLALPRADRLHLTLIDADYPGDTLFPAFEPADWRETAREPGPGFAFVTYERARSPGPAPGMPRPGAPSAP